MNEKIASLKKKQTNLRMFGTVFLVCLILCLLVGMKSQALSAALAAIMLLIYIFVIRSAMKHYRQSVKAATLEESFRPQFKQITYQPKDGITSDELTATGFLPIFHTKSILIRDTLRGTHRAMPAVLSDLTFDVETTRAGKKSVDYLSGCYFELKLSKSTGLNFALWPKDQLANEVLTRQYPDWRTVPFRLTGEKDHAFILCIPEGTPEEGLPENLLKAAARLVEYTPGEVALQVQKNHLRIFIRNRFLYPLQLKIQTPVTHQLLTDNPFPEIHHILRVADTLLP